MTRTALLSSIVILLFLSAIVRAEVIINNETTVSNSVSASASSGGNTAQNGESVVGESRARIFIETTVNGEVVESVDETAVSTTGEPVRLMRETRVEVGTTATGSEFARVSTSSVRRERGVGDIFTAIRSFMQYVIDWFTTL